MTIDQYESSRDQGEPVKLFEVKYGDGAAYRYTNAEEPVVFDEETYDPHPIEMSDLESKGRPDRSEVTVTVPLNSPVAELFRVYPPARVVSIIVREGHVIDQDQEFPLYFVGRILEGKRKGEKTELVCELTGASMKRPGLRRHYQWSCPLVLYGPRCKADKDAATIESYAAATTGNSITLPPGWVPQEGGSDAYAPGDFVGGVVDWQGANGTERLTILRLAGNELILSGTVRDIEIGDPVSVSLGCPHTLEGCGRLHNNSKNFGGHPFIRTGTNPVGKNTHF